jgi:branched-subunit amino acid ABC-type transport system permease component
MIQSQTAKHLQRQENEMKKLTPQAIKVLKMFHIFFAFCWVISALVLWGLLFVTNPESGDELYMRSLIVKILDDYLIIPGAIGVLITGLIYSIWTNWGFFKHTWITVKWIMTILQVVFGTFVLGPFVNNNVTLTDKLRDAALTDPEVLGNILTTQIWGTIQLALLLLMVVISVQKPWRRTR